MMNSYWGNYGKYQKELDKLNELTPDCGMTENKYINLFLTISNIYYDVYNNGGCNLRDNYPKRIENYLAPFSDELKTLRLNVTLNTLIKNFKNEEKLEAFMDEVIMYLQDKDLEYKMYTVFFNHETEELSKVEKEGFNRITFGLEDVYKDWIRVRIGWNYKWI